MFTPITEKETCHTIGAENMDVRYNHFNEGRLDYTVGLTTSTTTTSTRRGRHVHPQFLNPAPNG